MADSDPVALGDVLRGLGRNLAGLISSLPDRFLAAADRWVLSLHRPVEAEPGVYVRCWADGKPWPCRHAAEAADRMDSRVKAAP